MKGLAILAGVVPLAGLALVGVGTYHLAGTWVALVVVGGLLWVDSYIPDRR